MNVVTRKHVWSLPVALTAAGAMVVAPLTLSGPVPSPPALVRQAAERTLNATTTLAAAVTEFGARAVADVEHTGITAVTLLSNAPEALRRTNAHELASFVAQPAATATLVPVGAGGGVRPTSINAVAPRALAVAATGPLSDLLGQLQQVLGTIGQAFAAGPGEVVTSIGQILGGDPRAAYNTLLNLIATPIIGIGFFNLPAITTALSGLLPPLAPIFDALPTPILDLGAKTIDLVNGISDGFLGAYEAVRDGLAAGDVGAALSGAASAVLTAIKVTNQRLFSASAGVVPSLLNLGSTLLNAVGQVLRSPLAGLTTAATGTLGATSARAVSAPSDEKTKTGSTSGAGDDVTDSGSTEGTQSGQTPDGSAGTAGSPGEAPGGAPVADSAGKTHESATGGSWAAKVKAAKESASAKAKDRAAEKAEKKAAREQAAKEKAAEKAAKKAESKTKQSAGKSESSAGHAA